MIRDPFYQDIVERLVAGSISSSTTASPEECPPVAEYFPYGYLLPQSEPKSLLKVHNTL